MPIDISSLAPKLDALFADWTHPGAPGGTLAIIQDGEIVYKKGYGLANLEHDIPNTPATVYDIASISKQFVAFCVLLLAHRGRLSLDDDVRKYFPTLPDYGEKITLRHLIHHTSGLRDYLDLMAVSGLSFNNSYWPSEIVEWVSRQRGLNFKPGEQFSYSNTGYFLLGEVVQLVSGQKLGEFAQENIFTPLGMTSTRFWDDHTAIVKNRAWSYWVPAENVFRQALTTSVIVGDGGILTTVEDLFLWDQNFYGSKLEGGDHLTELLQTPGTLNDGTPLNYAFGLFLETYRGQQVVSHGGEWMGYVSQVMRFPDQHFSVILLCNRIDAPVTLLAYQVADLCLDGVLATAPTQPVTDAEASTGIDMPRETLTPYLGRYLCEDLNLVWTFTEQDGKLHVESSGGLVCAFAALGSGEFTAVNAPYPITLRFDLTTSNITLLVERQGQDNLTFARLTPVETTRLSTHIGTYFSDELNAAAHITLSDERLHIRIGRHVDIIPLETLRENQFFTVGEVMTVYIPRMFITFLEDGNAFTISAQSTKGVYFRKNIV